MELACGIWSTLGLPSTSLYKNSNYSLQRMPMSDQAVADEVNSISLEVVGVYPVIR